jgi:hypothetical protein
MFDESRWNSHGPVRVIYTAAGEAPATTKPAKSSVNIGDWAKPGRRPAGAETQPCVKAEDGKHEWRGRGAAFARCKFCNRTTSRKNVTIIVAPAHRPKRSKE